MTRHELHQTADNLVEAIAEAEGRALEGTLQGRPNHKLPIMPAAVILLHSREITMAP